MLAINAFLHLLNILTALMRLFWLLLAVLQLVWRYNSPLREALVHGHKTLFKNHAPPAFAKTQNPSPTVLFTPAFPLYYLIYRTLAPQLLHITADERALLLRGHRFKALAQSIINGTPSPFIMKLGVELPPQERLQYLVSLPDMIVTPPEDGDRVPLAGEIGGPKMRDPAKGLLAPPRRRARLGKVVKQAEKKKKRAGKKKGETMKEDQGKMLEK